MLFKGVETCYRYSIGFPLHLFGNQKLKFSAAPGLRKLLTCCVVFRTSLLKRSIQLVVYSNGAVARDNLSIDGNNATCIQVMIHGYWDNVCPTGR